MKELSELIEKELSFDPILEMERLTGGDYKKDKSIAWDSMFLAQENGKRKEELLKLNDDSYYGITIPEFKRLLSRLGFTMILEDPLDEGNFYRIFWRPDGLLLSTDSYYGDKGINGGNVMGCVNFGPEVNWFKLLRGTSNGPIDGRENARTFSYDIREGLRNKIETLASAGSFLNPWEGRQFVFLTSYMDWREGSERNYRDAHADRLSRLPEEVQKCVLF